MSTPEQQNPFVCPACGTPNELDRLVAREYRCSKCNMEVAHLDVAANGVIRGIFGWLRGVGDTIHDRYRIKSVLGKGGFGATYLVEDIRLAGKRRALKEVPELLFDEYETSLLSRLNHPSIPDIIDRHVTDGMVYLVLEFGGTRTLGAEYKANRQGVPVQKLLPWMRQLCDVLIYLHSQQPPIIHRDLKPDNILLDEHERIMLIDFGIAKESNPAGMTRTLGRAATLGFSPPEQVMGTGTDERADIYAMGATFYAMLTGQKPPAAHERVAGKELVRPSELVPGISPLLEGAILKSLNLNVNHRQQTVREFSDALDAVAAESTLGNSARTVDHDRTTVAGRGAAATIAVADTGGVSARQPSIRIPTAGTQSAAVSVPIPPVAGPARKLPVWMPLAASLAVLLAIAVGGYWLWPRGEPEKTSPQPPLSTAPTPPATPPVAIMPPQQPSGVPAPTPGSGPSVQPPVVNTAPMPGTAPQVPVATTPVPSPPARTPTGQSGESAQALLKEHLQSTPASEPSPPVVPVEPAMPKPLPPVKRVRTVDSGTTVRESRHRAAPEPRPKPQPQAEPTWTIIPGGSRRTD